MQPATEPARVSVASASCWLVVPFAPNNKNLGECVRHQASAPFEKSRCHADATTIYADISRELQLPSKWVKAVSENRIIDERYLGLVQ